MGSGVGSLAWRVLIFCNCGRFFKPTTRSAFPPPAGLSAALTTGSASHTLSCRGPPKTRTRTSWLLVSRSNACLAHSGLVCGLCCVACACACAAGYSCCLFVCFIASQPPLIQLRLQQCTTTVDVSSKMPSPHCPALFVCLFVCLLVCFIASQHTLNQ